MAREIALLSRRTTPEGEPEAKTSHVASDRNASSGGRDDCEDQRKNLPSTLCRARLVRARTERPARGGAGHIRRARRKMCCIESYTSRADIWDPLSLWLQLVFGRVLNLSRGRANPPSQDRTDEIHVGGGPCWSYRPLIRSHVLFCPFAIHSALSLCVRECY